MAKKSIKPAKETEDNLYEVKFWKQNNTWGTKLPPLTLLRTEFTYAKNEREALRNLEYRANEKARTRGHPKDYQFVSMFAREDVVPHVIKTTDSRWLEKERETEQKENLRQNSVCRQCGTRLDDDYCQQCGWRRESWFNRAMSKQGEFINH